MLVITRRIGETFYIGDDVEVTISDVVSEKVKVAINAPKHITILRKELVDAQKLNRESLESGSVIKPGATAIASFKAGMKKLTAAAGEESAKKDKDQNTQKEFTVQEKEPQELQELQEE